MPVIRSLERPRTVQELRQAIALLITDHFGGPALVTTQGVYVEFEDTFDDPDPVEVSAAVAVVDLDRHPLARSQFRRWADDAPTEEEADPEETYFRKAVDIAVRQIGWTLVLDRLFLGKQTVAYFRERYEVGTDYSMDLEAIIDLVEEMGVNTAMDRLTLGKQTVEDVQHLLGSGSAPSLEELSATIEAIGQPVPI